MGILISTLLGDPTTRRPHLEPRAISEPRVWSDTESERDWEGEILKEIRLSQFQWENEIKEEILLRISRDSAILPELDEDESPVPTDAMLLDEPDPEP